MPDTVRAVDERTPALPDDFGLRIRAAAGYLGLGLEKFAKLVDRDGAGYSTMKTWIRTKSGPNELAQRALIERLAEVSGLPESFFWDDPPADADSERLSQIEDDLRALRAQVTIGAAEALQRIEEGVETILRSLPPPPQ